MADRMVSLVSDPSVYQRCREMGLERAKDFSWDRCASRTLEILHEFS
jgi:alpha-1,3-rhamnosyl/mannosyltransferase